MFASICYALPENKNDNPIRTGDNKDKKLSTGDVPASCPCDKICIELFGGYKICMSSPSKK